jgi:hypothetical protein
MMNNERSRQMREDLKLRMDDLSKQVENLTAKAEQALEQRRPDIEETIQRGRKVAASGLDKAKSLVDQSAERAQEYVQKMGQQTQDAAEQAGDKVKSAADNAGATEFIGGNGHQGQEPMSYDESNNPSSY